MKILTLAIVSSMLLLTTGCASGVKRGAVAMKVSDTVAHVSLGSDEVKIGDTVTLFRSDCRHIASSKKSKRSECTKRKVGKGIVKETINKDYSVVEADAGVSLAEGDVVETSAS